ncbi:MULTISPECIES: hypothetical protein [Serratia]|uniref:hypothetical protein n=1 Tax=Serratia TaxID=613 RepID=UPI0011B5E671|nr:MULTISPECIES: hypothetical protein [Serratia]MDI9108894.1 hypothetical protein [Serratia marcescens]MDR8489262.1 hypothetical protein [Serratia nevei]MDR8536558.1 hypothetical protein [Serratia nevei]QFH61681.1 hypothetical protein FR888_21585 [Serratia marcescens]QSD86201.1 hypothetical protein JMM80_20055 [Serratia marcescens]
MAASLLELVIPASVSVVVACGTVIWTVKSNRKLENEKHLKQKKEELFTFYLDSLSIAYDLYQASHDETKVTSIANGVRETLKNNLLKIKTLSALYFPSLDGIDLQDASTYTHRLIKDICEGRSPEEKRYNEVLRYMNKLHEKILSLKW